METMTSQVKDILTKIDKLDDRVRNMEKYLWIAFGSLGVLQLAAPYISKFIGVK